MSMRKISPFIIAVLIFVLTFIYLHQKTQIYVYAYKLNDSHTALNKLVDERDYFLYNFTKEISLDKLSEWAENNDFSPPEKEKVLALNLRKEKQPVKENRLASLIKRLFKSTGSSTAMAQDQQ